jgi:cysteine desulfurase family protein
MIYLDNAATSWPKPPAVAETVRDWLLNIGASPGRSAYRTAASSTRIVFDAREALARMLGIADSRHLLFMSGATFALNTVIRGLLQDGRHVVTTSMEHNSVMRPLRWMSENQGAEIQVIEADAAGRLDAAAFASAVRPDTRLVVVNHGSNVTGTLAPLTEIRQAIGAVPLLVDAAQTAGVVPIDVENLDIDLLACSGHKGLLGPTGTGCLYIRPGLADRIPPLVCGGTGSRSESDEQPHILPDRYESGTPNAAGIAGLGAAAQYILGRGVADLRRHEQELIARLLDGLRAVHGVQIYGPGDPAAMTATVSINLDGWTPDQVGLALDRRYDIMVRVGLHCAPAAHRTIGTFPEGTVRLSLGAFSTADDVDAVLAALKELAAEERP